MSENNKEKVSFVSTKDQRIKELAKNRKTSRAPSPPEKERTLFDVYDRTNELLERIANVLEGKVKTNVVADKVTNNLIQESKDVSLKAKAVPSKKTKKVTSPKKLDSAYVREVRDAFLQDVNDVFDIKDEGDYVTIKSRGYVGTEIYMKVEQVILEDFGGEKVAGVKEKGKWKSYPFLRIHKRNFE